MTHDCFSFPLSMGQARKAIKYPVHHVNPVKEVLTPESEDLSSLRQYDPLFAQVGLQGPVIHISGFNTGLCHHGCGCAGRLTQCYAEGNDVEAVIYAV
jgi:hypothetical protein